MWCSANAVYPLSVQRWTRAALSSEYEKALVVERTATADEKDLAGLIRGSSTRIRQAEQRGFYSYSRKKGTTTSPGGEMRRKHSL